MSSWTPFETSLQASRRRPVYIVSNNTLVESPVFQEFVDRLLARLEESLHGLNVPLKVVRTHPVPEESFWVNLLGKGYPAPNRTFRWCTDQFRILKGDSAKHGETVLN